MNNIYKYENLSDINQAYFNSVCKTIWENENEAKELVAKKLINIFGYPNNIELYTFQNSNKTEFVDVKTNATLASVETINDGIVFYTETKYYGDWFR